MYRRYLEEIGCKDYPENIYGNPKDKRIDEYRKFYEKTGVWKADTWNLNGTAMMWIYERLIQYKEDCNVDLNYHMFDFDGKKWTQGELIDEMIEIAEYCLWEPDNLSKQSEAYKRLSNNKYYKELGKFDTWSSREIYEKQFNVEQSFWKIWAEVYPAMWW